MGLYVLKFGGTSVANLTRIKHVSDIVAKYRYAGHQVVVVVSAMQGITDQLVGFADALCPHQKTPEHDLVYATGEQVTAGLVSLSLQQMGFLARSFVAWQIPIQTDHTPTYARIEHIPTDHLHRCLDQGITPVVAGFQGLSPDHRVTTLGRGGSDTTAVALAVSLNAKSCDIYTDVDGVYSADPGVIPNARRHDYIDYHCMFEMASNGAKVLQSRCVELAMRHQVCLRVLSTFVPLEQILLAPCTQIGDKKMEDIRFVGLTHLTDEMLVSIKFCDKKMMRDFWDFAKNSGIDLDFVQHIQHPWNQSQVCDLTFTCKKKYADSFNHFFESHHQTITVNFMNTNVVKICLIGPGIKEKYLSIIHDITDILESLGQILYGIHVSEVRLMMVINQENFAKVLQHLHAHFRLDTLFQAA